VNGYFQISRASGGLAGLDTLDVSTATGASSALSRIESYIQTAVDSQAQLGTTEKRLEIQSNFMSKLVDSFNNGIGSLVDADMEEASARLKALQTQQQLGVQALSIANQAPSTLMTLFR
jgi:flagellin